MPRPRALMTTGNLVGERDFIAYYRVSTDQQGRSGLGLEAQRAMVAAYLVTSVGHLIGAFEEVESGKRNSRPQLAAALSACRAKRAILIVAKLDRLARNARFLLAIAEGVGDGGVVFCDLPQLPPGPMGKFFLTLMAAVAELESGLISQRTTGALAEVKKAIARDGSWISRRSGLRITRLGGPSLQAGNAGGAAAGRATQSKRSRERSADVLPFIEQAKCAGCKSLRQIAQALTNRGIRPPSGGERWHAQQVRRVIARAAMSGDPR